MPSRLNYIIEYLSDLDENTKVSVRKEINNVIENTDTLVTTAHNIEILNVLCSSFGYEQDILLIRGENSLEGFMPLIIIGNKIVSIPHFSYGGYIGKRKITPFLSSALIKSLRQKYGNNFLIRDFKQLTEYSYNEKISCFLELEQDAEVQFSKFSSKLRSQIRKAKKNGLTVTTSNIDEFFPIYVSNMHRLGSPHLPRYFFKEIIKNYNSGCVEVFVVKNNTIAIGSSIVLTFEDFSEVTWAATYKEFNHLAPNMLLYWEMIKYSINNNMKIFSFGRASIGSNSWRFKKQWGPKEVQLIWNYSSPKRFRIESLKFLTIIWSYCPKYIIKILGPMITKYIY